MSELDALTQLNTRAAYEEELKNAKQADLCVIYFDINNLKHTNDTLGHRLGDKLITTVAKEIKSQFRSEEVFRTGGDEFIVLLNGIGPVAISKRISTINENLRLITEKDPDGIIYSVASGYAIGDGIKSKVDLENEAESNMYFDKKKQKAKAPQLDERNQLPPIRGFGGQGVVIDRGVKEKQKYSITDETMSKVNENVKEINKLYMDVSKSAIAGIVISLLTFLTLTGILLYM